MNDLQCKTGFGARKFLWERDNATLAYRVVNYAYLRLPEIYLSYAEALNETGRTGEAYSWINKVRNRVDLPEPFAPNRQVCSPLRRENDRSP